MLDGILVIHSATAFSQFPSIKPLPTLLSQPNFLKVLLLLISWTSKFICSFYQIFSFFTISERRSLINNFNFLISRWCITYIWTFASSLSRRNGKKYGNKLLQRRRKTAKCIGTTEPRITDILRPSLILFIISTLPIIALDYIHRTWSFIQFPSPFKFYTILSRIVRIRMSYIVYPQTSRHLFVFIPPRWHRGRFAETGAKRKTNANTKSE